MSRSYTLKKRAEQQAETRQRIVDAAIDLHGTLGPARTSLSAVADRAGVQRKTLYAHFPDERSLLLACSGLSMERDPLPDAEGLRAVANPGERLRAGLSRLYAYYARNSGLIESVLRDAGYHEPTREIADLRIAPAIAAMADVLGEGLTADQRILLPLALSFHSWRALARESGLRPEQAVEVMTAAIASAR
jgi:AcrR family transcriptional regulator